MGKINATGANSVIGLLNIPLLGGAAAGIGGGVNGNGTVNIYGGKVSAVGGGNADIIGLITSGGLLSLGGNTNVLSLITTSASAGIGGGTNGSGTVKITGGQIEAMGGSSAIGNGLNG